MTYQKAKGINSRNPFLIFLLCIMMTFSMNSFSIVRPIEVKAAEGEAILDLDNINQNPAVNFSAIKNSSGKMIISNDSTAGGFETSGITNTSYLLTSSKISGDFSVEAKLRVLSRTLVKTSGVVGIGAFAEFEKNDALVASVARGDSGSRSYYKKADGSYGGGNPNLTSTSDIGKDITLKLQRVNGVYTAIINGQSNNLSGLNTASSGDMYLGFVVCGTTAEVDSFIIKQDENVIFDLSQPMLPRPVLTAEAVDNDIELNWTAVEGALSYTTEYKKADNNNWMVTQPSVTTGSAITVTGLETMVPYKFRVKANEGVSKNLYSASVMAVPGFDWMSVEKPEITSKALSTNGTEVTSNFKMVMGALGATKLEVDMLKDNQIVDTKSVIEAVLVLGASSGSVKFIPSESGTYTFIAKASRNGESTVKLSEPFSFDFDLPVANPVVRATAVKTGVIKVAWDAVKEAESYKIEYRKNGDTNWIEVVSSATDLSYSVNNLEVNADYDFKVTAFKGNKSAETILTAKAKEVVGEVVEWKSIIFGQSISSNNNSININNVDETVTITAGTKDGSSAGGKVTGSHDGISYYYTEIDPSKNFELSANIKVNFFAKSTPDNQEAFGIMARDAIGTNLDTTVFASNMVMVGGYRGLVQSVFRNNVKEASGAGATMEDVFKFGDRPANDGTTTYKLTLKKTNTGYYASVDNGTEKIYYRPKQLEVLNSEKIYVGFFAARVASITASNITIATSDVATDPPGIPEPPKPVEPSINMVSLKGSPVSDYEYKIMPNVNGNIQIKQNGTLIYDGAIDKSGNFTKQTTLIKGDNTFDLVFTPDPTENITSKEPISVTHIVTHRAYGEVGGTIYVSQNGTENGKGTIVDPIDIYSAVKFINKGQTIYVKGGTYKLNAPVIIERGNDGTVEEPKVLTSYGTERPVFDFDNKSEGLLLAGDAWKIYGIDVTKAVKTGFRVSGNYNVVELVNTYANGDTGLQISGSSSESKSLWPSNNLVLNCTSYDNRDAAENNADGFAAKLTVGKGNVFRGCIAHNNTDDGWDLYSKLETGPIEPVVIENCIAYGNGTLSNGTKTKGDGNGFKMGGEGLAVEHILRNSLSFNNNSTGVTSNSDPAIIVENTTSADNGGANYSFAYYVNATPQFEGKNNVSFRTKAGVKDSYPGYLLSENNYFNDGLVSQNIKGEKVLASDFMNVVFNGTYRRNSDGTIAVNDFMTIKINSKVSGGAKLWDFPNNGSDDDQEDGAHQTGGQIGGNTTPSEISTANLEAVKKVILESSQKAVEIHFEENSPKIEQNIFEALKEKDKIITFINRSSNGTEIYSWTFDGKSIKREVKSVDLTINASSSKADEIISAADNSDIVIVSFSHEGDLPGTAEIKIKLDSTWLKNKGNSKLYLYYYNPNTKHFESIAEDLKADGEGYIKFNIDHCSDYIIIDELQAKTIELNNSKYTSGLVEEAIKAKTFYNYNIAYNQVMKLTDSKSKEELLNKLSTISTLVWNEDIKYINSELDKLVSTASGKIYDEIQVKIEATALNEVDKAYLMGEVTSWGKKLVWTEEYLKATEEIVKAWTNITEININKAEEAVSKIKNEYSKQYLLEELGKIKQKYNK